MSAISKRKKKGPTWQEEKQQGGKVWESLENLVIERLPSIRRTPCAPDGATDQRKPVLPGPVQAAL